MSDRIDSLDNDNNNNNSVNEELSPGYCLTFKILLIILMIINLFMLMFFGMNHVVFFTVSMTLIIRMFIGLQNKRPKHFINSLFLFNMIFACHIIKIVFRFIMTYFVNKKQYKITNLKDMDIIVTETILWIPGFDIKLNGMWTLIILILFMVYWAVLIILFENKRNCFNYIDQIEYDEYLVLINQYNKLPKQLPVINNQEENKNESKND